MNKISTQNKRKKKQETSPAIKPGSFDEYLWNHPDEVEKFLREHGLNPEELDEMLKEGGCVIHIDLNGKEKTFTIQKKT